LGMARAQAAAGQTDIAAEYYQMLIDIWQGNDGFEGVTEAHAYLAGNPGGS